MSWKVIKNLENGKQRFQIWEKGKKKHVQFEKWRETPWNLKKIAGKLFKFKNLLKEPLESRISLRNILKFK